MITRNTNVGRTGSVNLYIGVSDVWCHGACEADRPRHVVDNSRQFKRNEKEIGSETFCIVRWTHRDPVPVFPLLFFWQKIFLLYKLFWWCWFWCWLGFCFCVLIGFLFCVWVIVLFFWWFFDCLMELRGVLVWLCVWVFFCWWLFCGFFCGGSGGVVLLLIWFGLFLFFVWCGGWVFVFMFCCVVFEVFLY